MPINKAFIDKILKHVVEISNNECSITDDSILDAYKEDVTKAELLSGLLFLSETIEYQKNIYITANHELNKKNDDLEEFAYITSHDLKSPLRGIYALASFIEEDIKSNAIEDVYSSITLLKDKIMQMEKLINGLLEYSKASNDDENYSWINIEDCINDVKALLFLSENTNIEVTNSLPLIYGIRTKIFQVFYNLIDNAIKYSNKEQIHISISSKTTENKIDFYIKDNGPGIKKAYHEKIFKMFQTIEENEAQKGTGIGLSLVKKIIDLHNGQINITSIENEGCTFILSFPIQKNKNEKLLSTL